MFLILRILSLVVVSVFVAVGLAIASAILPLLIGLGLLAAFGALCVRQEEPRLAASRYGRSPVRLTTAVAGGVVVAVYVAIGMTALLGGAVPAMTAATALGVLGYHGVRGGSFRNGDHTTRAGASSPGTGDPTAGSWAGGRPGEGSPDATGSDAGTRRLLPADPATVSTTELCRAWRLSYLLLQNARVPEALEDAAELRRRYLDELARRHPEGFRRWLADGARAAGDPSRYVRHPCDPVDRDEDQAA